jgi:hypothetical protein
MHTFLLCLEHIALWVKLIACWVLFILHNMVADTCILCHILTPNIVLCGHVQVFYTIRYQIIRQIEIFFVALKKAIDLGFLETKQFSDLLLLLFANGHEVLFSELGVFRLEVGFNFIVDIEWTVLSVKINIYINFTE